MTRPTVFGVASAAVLLALVSLCGPLHAQRMGKLDYETASQLGLVPVWSKTIPTGYGGKVTGVTIHVSPQKSYQGTEIVDKYGRRTFFSDRNVMARRASRSGYDQTLRLTDLKKAQLTSLGLAPRSEVKQIPDVTMYVRSTAGTVTALDAETGQQKWSSLAGKAGYPSYGISANDEHVVTLSGANIYLLAASDGQVVDNVPTRFLPGGTPTLDGSFIYLPTNRGIIEVISADDLGRKEYTLGSSGSIDNPVTVSPQTVSWTTTDGFLYVAKNGAPGVRYRFQSLGSISSAPAYAKNTLYATSMDGFAYALEEATGDVKWRYSAGGPIRENPVVVDGCLFVTTTEGQMSVLNADTGETKWLASGVERLLSVSDTTIYCITSGNQLTALDQSSGARIGSVYVGELGLPILNTKTDRVYLLSPSGVLQCFRDAGRRWPVARKPPVAEETPKSQTTRTVDEVPTASEPVEDVPSAEESEDLFGDFGAEEDPAEDAGGDAGIDEVADDLFGEDLGGDDLGGDDLGGDDLGADDMDDSGDEEDPFGDF